MALHSIISDGNIRAMLAVAERCPPGAFVEVGVYQGGSAERLYILAQEQKRDLHLFDTFSGMPVANALDTHKIGEFADIEIATLHMAMPKAIFHKGIFPYTLPANLTNLAFVHCDCDQYFSYRAVIDHLYPRLVPGGALLFDDYPYLEGAKRAVEESFDSQRLILADQRYYVVKP